MTDKNGYAPSILQPDADPPYCAICFANGAADPLNRHEVFGGAYRDKASAWGCGCGCATAGATRRGRIPCTKTPARPWP